MIHCPLLLVRGPCPIPCPDTGSVADVGRDSLPMLGTGILTPSGIATLNLLFSVGRHYIGTTMLNVNKGKFMATLNAKYNTNCQL